MKFQESVEICVTKKFADFGGLATRSEFWWFALFCFVVNAILSKVSLMLGGIFGLAMFIPYLAVGARRLRDTDRSPFWLLIGLVPLVGIIVLIVFWAQPGKSETTPT
jgi:uncharacterized membrane protein YhaH (DUF805 family)